MRLGKTGGAVAALALVSIFVFGGAEAAHAASVTLTPFDSSGATNSAFLSNNVHGTADPSTPITVTMTNAGTTTPYCTTTADGLGYWTCPPGAEIPLGSTTFTATDGTTSATSAAIMIYGTNGPSLTKPTPGSSVLSNPVFFGYGPARGSIGVYADTGGGPLCTVAVVADSGQWNCASTVTLPAGANGFSVMSSTPGYPSDTFFSSMSNPVPVTVSELTAPAVSYSMGYATGTSTATTSFDDAAVYTELYSVTEPDGEGNGYESSYYPQLSCSPSSASDAAVRECDFGDLPAGIWKAASYQYLGEQSSPYQNDFFRIPEAPTMAANGQPDQTVAFSGTGTTGDLASVIADDGTAICSSAVTAGSWSCSAAATPGTHSYRAYQLDQGWVPYTDDSGNVAGVRLGTVVNGRSALTAPATATVTASPTPPAAPTMSYVLGYATGSSTATGAEGALVHTELYHVTEPEGEGNGYSFDSPVVECSPGSGGTSSPATGPSVQECEFGALTPGIWNVYSWQDVDGLDSPFQNDFFRVPEAPTITASGHADQTVSFSGTGTTGDIVQVVTQVGASVCSATVVAGSWSCTAVSAVGSLSYRAYQLDQGWAPYTDELGNIGNAPLGIVLSGLSALTPIVTATVPAPPPPVPPSPAPSVPTPPVATALPTLFSWLLTVTGADGPLHPGDSVTLSSSGLPAGATVEIFLHSTPVDLGSTVVGGDGVFSKIVVIPEDTEPGDHHFVVTVTPVGSHPSTIESPVTIVQTNLAVGPAQAEDQGQTDAAAPNGGKAASSGDHRNALSAPSAFTNALPTITALLDNPGALAVAAGLALAIMLLVALPTEILDSAVSSNLDRFGPFLRRASTAAERATAWLDRITKGSAASSVIMILLSSIIFGFADPGYGFNLVSLRLTLSIVVALSVVYYIAPKISRAFIRRGWGVESTISIQPIALVFAVIGVIVGRLLGFSPGFLIGLAIGLELAASASIRHRARSMMVQVGVIVGLALLAWAGYSMIALSLGTSEGSVWTGFVQDTLATITAEGLTGMLLGLFPLAFFEGKDVWDYSKRLWAALFLVTGTAFAFLVLPTAIAPDSIGQSVPVWLMVLGCFTVLSLGVWLYLKLTSKPGAESSEEPVAEKIDA